MAGWYADASFNGTIEVFMADDVKPVTGVAAAKCEAPKLFTSPDPNNSNVVVPDGMVAKVIEDRHMPAIMRLTKQLPQGKLTATHQGDPDWGRFTLSVEKDGKTDLVMVSSRGLVGSMYNDLTFEEGVSAECRPIREDVRAKAKGVFTCGNFDAAAKLVNDMAKQEVPSCVKR
ncbi:MAG: hypothetical protein V4735_00370 [Pseudomonadota bacterium]